MIKHLCSVKLRQDISGLEIACHPEATHFICKSGQIHFYKVNPKPSKLMRKIPSGVNTMNFSSYRIYRGWINYGNIEFKSHQGNILKTENYNGYNG